MKGVYPNEYLKNPNVAKPIEKIWDDIDAYTGEFFEDELQYHWTIDFIIPIPPLLYEGKFTKGVLFTQAASYILKLFPKLKDLFFVGAYTMWSNYSWCENADFYLTCYQNKQREEYYKKKYPNKKDIVFVPLQDADFTNEYIIAPTWNTPKLFDVICVSSPNPFKNLPMLAQALKIYKEKYQKTLKTALLLGQKNIKRNNDGSVDYSILHSDQRKELDKFFNLVSSFKKEIEVVPFVNHHKELPKFYTASKCCVLTSLIEGKNRSLNEAQSCNTPIIAFKDHNKWARAQHPIFYENSGELVEDFNPESLADTIHKVINNPQNYKPRKNYLKYNGRKNFINVLLESLSYFKENIPEYIDGHVHENLWLDLAMQNNYQLSFYDFLYGKNPLIQHVKGINDISKLVDFFYKRFNMIH